MSPDVQHWWVYIISTESGRLYTGISTDVARRFAEHRNVKGGKGAKFFRTDRPKSIVYKEIHSNRSEASKREAAIKKLSRRAKCALVGIVYESLR